MKAADTGHVKVFRINQVSSSAFWALIAKPWEENNCNISMEPELEFCERTNIKLSRNIQAYSF